MYSISKRALLKVTMTGRMSIIIHEKKVHSHTAQGASDLLASFHDGYLRISKTQMGKVYPSHCI